jgi:hypothetical protein
MENKDKTTDLKEIVLQKNDIISNQTKRINMLEDKLDEVRQRYFQLKKFMSLRGYGGSFENSI